MPSKTGSDRLVIGELEEWIRSGRLRVGQRLPSVKKLQKILGVGQKSVESAKAVLEQRGWIETRNRSGSYVRLAPGRLCGNQRERTACTPHARSSSTFRSSQSGRFPFTRWTAPGARGPRGAM